VPVSVIICGLSAELSVSVIVAARDPAAVARNVTERLQFDPAATLLPQLLLAMAKSPGFPPPRTVLEILSAPVPELVTVTDCAADVTPILPEPKLRDDADNVAVGTPTPVPDSVTCCGLPLALSVTVKTAERVPAAVASNVTEMLQLPAAATLPAQLLVVAKSPAFVPVIAMPEMVRVPDPALLSVTDCAAEVTPILPLPKLSALGDTEADATPTPVPLKATVCGLLVALSVKTRLAERDPAAPGSNVIDTLHDDPAARLVLHVLPLDPKSVAFVPLMAMLVIVSAALPPFVSVTVCPAVVTPTFELPNASD
jgi:hypothetical protein